MGLGPIHIRAQDRSIPHRYSSVLLDKHSIPHCHSASTPAPCHPSIMGGQIKLKSWRDDVTGHIPERQYLCHLLNPDPMRATFPPEKATSVTMSAFCDGSITPHRTSTSSLWEMPRCASQQNRSSK